MDNLCTRGGHLLIHFRVQSLSVKGFLDEMCYIYDLKYKENAHLRRLMGTLARFLLDFLKNSGSIGYTHRFLL